MNQVDSDFPAKEQLSILLRVLESSMLLFRFDCVDESVFRATEDLNEVLIEKIKSLVLQEALHEQLKDWTNASSLDGYWDDWLEEHPFNPEAVHSH